MLEYKTGSQKHGLSLPNSAWDVLQIAPGSRKHCFSNAAHFNYQLTLIIFTSRHHCVAYFDLGWALNCILYRTL